MEISNSVMTAEEIRMILATGGPGVVQASYTSGKPALGVGGGNAPVLVDELANLKVACGSIITGKVRFGGFHRSTSVAMFLTMSSVFCMHRPLTMGSSVRPNKA